MGWRKGALSRERLCSLESYRSTTASAHVCPERIDIWMSATVGGKKWGKKHRKGNIFRASNMSVVDFDFSPVSGPRKVITPARCSITDQPASPSRSLSLFLSPSRKNRLLHLIASPWKFSRILLCRVDEFHGIFPPPNIFRRGKKSPGKIKIMGKKKNLVEEKIWPKLICDSIDCNNVTKIFKKNLF